MSAHLFLDLSSHGFGHVAQAAPVVNALRERLPDLQLTVRGGFERALLARRLHGRFELIVDGSLDVGMVMGSAIDVRRAQSARAYRRLHARWDAAVADCVQGLRRLRPTLLLSCVPHLGVAAAARAGTPALAMSSLNWADVFHHYCRGYPGADTVHAQILEAYRRADAFLRLEPGLPMTDLPNRISVGPVGALGRPRRREVEARLDLRPDQRLGLVALGGIEMSLPLAAWPPTPGLTWLVPGDPPPGRPDLRPLGALDVPFVDVLASCDLVLTKPGYGTFVEAACHGVPVLYVQRGDWPEAPYLTAWLHRHANARELPRESLACGDFGAAVERLLACPARAPATPTGVEEAADLILRRLG